MTRRFPPPAYRALKTGWRLLVEELGGVEATAAATRVGKTQVSDYGAVPRDERYAPVDVVMDAEALAGRPLVTAALARAQGFDLVPVTPREPGELAVLLARIGRDSSDLFGRAVGVLGGAPIPAGERGAMIQDLEDLRIATAETLALLRDGAGAAP